MIITAKPEYEFVGSILRLGEALLGFFSIGFFIAIFWLVNHQITTPALAGAVGLFQT